MMNECEGAKEEGISFILACSHQPSYGLLGKSRDISASVYFAGSPSSLIPNTSIIILDQQTNLTMLIILRLIEKWVV